jgi:hypothetical protein
MKQSVKGRTTSESKLLDKLSNFATNSAEIKQKEYDLQERRLEQQMKMDDRRLALREKQIELETKKLEFLMREQSYSRSGSYSSSSKTPSSRYSDSVLDSSKLSSSLSPDAEYDSEVSLDLRIRQEMVGTSSKEKDFDPDNESNEQIKRDMYLDYERTKRSYGAYGVSPGKASYKSVRSSDSDLLDYNFANADEVRKSIIERNIMEASQIREAEVHDLTANSPSYKKLRHEMDPNNMMNPFWDNNNIIYSLITNHIATMMAILSIHLNQIEE